MTLATEYAKANLSFRANGALADWQGTITYGVYPNIKKCVETTAKMREAFAKGGEFEALAGEPLMAMVLASPEIVSVEADLQALLAKIEAIDIASEHVLFQVTQPEGE